MKSTIQSADGITPSAPWVRSARASSRSSAGRTTCRRRSARRPCAARSSGGCGTSHAPRVDCVAQRAGDHPRPLLVDDGGRSRRARPTSGARTAREELRRLELLRHELRLRLGAGARRVEALEREEHDEPEQHGEPGREHAEHAGRAVAVLEVAALGRPVRTSSITATAIAVTRTTMSAAQRMVMVSSRSSGSFALRRLNSARRGGSLLGLREGTVAPRREPDASKTKPPVWGMGNRQEPEDNAAHAPLEHRTALFSHAADGRRPDDRSDELMPAILFSLRPRPERRDGRRGAVAGQSGRSSLATAGTCRSTAASTNSGSFPCARTPAEQSCSRASISPARTRNRCSPTGA